MQFDWDSLEKNYQPIDLGVTNAQYGAKPKKKKGFWTDQISTGGGISGALGGAAAGAVAGSVLPGIGTAIGGIAGALLGGGLGSAGGEVVENRITGDSWNKNVLKEGLIGGVTSLPIGAGFKLARAGVKTALGREGAQALVQQAGLQTIPKKTLTKLAGSNTIDDTALDTFTSMSARSTGRGYQSANNLADSVIASQSGMTASQARKLGIKPVETFGNIFNRTGLTKLDDMSEVGKNLTGSGQNSILDVLTRAAFEDTRGVKLNGLRRTAEKIMDDGTSLLASSERKRVLENMKYAETAIYGGSKGSISGSGDALKALDQANAFRSVANNLGNGFSVTPKDRQLAKIYNGVASDIERALYGAQGVSGTVSMLTKAGADDILFNAQAAREVGKEAQAKAYESVAKELRAATSVKDIRSLKKDWVDLSRIDKATAEAQGARTLTGQQFTTNIANSMSPKAALGAVVDANATSLAGKLKDIAARDGGVKAIGQGIVPLTARQAVGRSMVPQDSTYDQESLLPEGVDVTMNEESSASSTIGGFTRYQLAEGLMSAYQSGDTEAVKEIKGMYDLATELEKSQSPSGGMGRGVEATKNRNNATTGMKSIDDLEQMINQDGSIVSRAAAPDLSLLNSALGTSTYRSAIKNAQDAMSRLRSGASMTEQESARFDAMLPRIGDNPEAIKYKIAQFRDYFNSYIQDPGTDLPLTNATPY